uniref:Zinc finger protein 292 n=1 Tax=Amazona collaria TaxID=241587 RepID=A0A8B9GA67_9PSIT
MADEEAEQESGSLGGDLLEMQRLRERLVELETGLRESPEPAVQAATEYCKQLCQTLLEYAQKWKTSEDPLPLLEVYRVAIRSYVKARPYLTSECENVAFVLERLALSCIELLLCLPIDLPDNRWEEFQAFVQLAHKSLMENGSRELHILTTLTQEKGAWKNPVLCGILSQEQLDPDKVNDFLVFEGPILLDMRIKHLMKTKQITQATALAKLCSDHPEISAKGNFKQTYLVCLCSGSPNEKLMEEISEVDCKDALEMICNLESDGDEKSALILCAAFLSRQLQQGEMYCAWELTLFWSKLQQRVEPSIQVYLERCRQLSVLTKTVYHIFFLIKVINSEIDSAGLATCIELCVKALRLESSENADVKISICKTISCLLPDDLEVKRACQLSEFLLEPTVDAYYAVEMLYNQPDQKYDEENLPIPNSLRCELLLVLKTQWPFDPEFWDWKTLKRQCLALMGEEASIVSSIDELNDSEVYEKLEDCQEETKEASMNGLAGTFDGATSLLQDIGDEKQKKREIKKLRERGFISARFRNWQAYMQYCVLCDKEFLGHRIVRHAQKHYKDGIYSCPICAENFNSKENFVPHVTLHVKNSSKERLAAMKPLKRLGRPPKIATANENQKTNPVSKQEQRPIKKNSLYSTDFIVFNDNDGSDDENNDKDKPYIPEIVPVQKPLPVNEFTCPVSFCKKGFKYFKNLIAHAKGHKDNEEAKRFLEMQSKKVICQYCRRHFVSVTHLNDHLQMHCGSKPYICIQMKCKAGFNSYAELLTHRKEHQVFRAKCMFPKCGRVFSEAYLLYDHEAQHYNTFTCKVTSCGKVYRSQNELEKHVEDHSKQPEVVQQPEAVQQPESQTNQPDLRQPANANENTDGVAVKEELTSPPADNPSSFTEGENIVWNEVKAEPAGNESINASAIVLQQSDSLPNDAGLEKSLTGSVKAEVAIPSSSIKVPAVNQKIQDNFVKRENGPMSLFPSTAENPPNSVFSQVEDNTNNFSSQLEGNGSSAFTKEETVVQLFPSRLGNENNFIETSSQDPASEKVKKDRVRDLNGRERKPKHNKRAKWPAIIRDGKFICSRCFRVFTNPRSLGGHLSKRSYCKPLEGSEISAEALQANGQSLLASMILSSNSLNLQQPQESAFNPEMCFKDPSFLQLLAAENRSTALLKTVFPRASVTNFNTGGNEEGNQIMKQALETAGIPSTFDNTEVLPHVVSTSCITATTQINASVLPSSTTSPLVQPACNPSTLLKDQTRTRKIVCRRLPVFTRGGLMPTKFEDDLCPDSFSDPVPAAQNIAGNSSRVSAISSPTDAGSSNLNKKGTSASKKKKKVTMPLLVPNTSPKVEVNNTVVGLLTKSTEGNVQMQGEGFQSNLLASCGSQVVENLTQKLNNVDNQLLMTSIKENFKTDLEAHTTLPPLTVKNENGDSQMVAVNSCVQANSEKKISEDNVLQNCEKTMEMLKTALNTDILEVKTEIQDTIGASGQNSQVNNAQASSGDSAHSVKLPQFAVHVGNVTAAKSSSAQSEMSQKDDTQMLEITERLQKLKLDEDPPIPVSQTVSQCPPTDTLAPGVPVVSTENKTLIQLSAEASNIQFSDKVNKPFVCQDPGCSYSAMTKDALFKHYGKIHQYTAEMILEIKKHQLKYAPFKCVVATCPKTFTRNSNLRAHCQLVHHFTTEEMVKLKIKRPYGRRSQNETVNTASRPVEIKTLHPLTIGTKTAAPLVKEAQTKEVIEPVIVLEKLISENIPERLEKPPQVISVLPEQHSAVSFGSAQAEAKLHKVRRYRKEKEDRKRRKPVPKSLEFPTRYSPYRPYRCVHQGCFAAFTIQQNLILHYQAVHKSDLPAFSAEVEEENEPGREERDEVETKPVVKEFRCDVSDCSRIFQEVTGLIQHYMKLHNMTPEQIGNMKPSPEVGRFSCDQSQCKSSFTAYLNYVVHLEADHGIKIKPNKVEDDGVFRCDCEGCDRVYATRSNLLRHIFNKHNDRHKDHLIRPRRLTPDQENNSSKANQEKPLKSKQRVLKNRSAKECNRLSGKTKLKKNLNLDDKNSKGIQVEENQGYSLKRGKHVYSIKARNDALLECTSRFITQYPCMIKGCSSVVTSESNIIRHYKCHKLSKAFTSQHRNLLIVSKKLSVLPVKEDSCEQEETDKKSDVKEPEPSLIVSNKDSSTTTLPQKETEKGEKDEVDELTELFITKLINEDCSSAENQAKISSSVNSDLPETNSCPSEKQKINLKRANKEKNVSQSKRRKIEKPEEVLPADVSSTHREEETAVAIQTAEEQPAAFDWSSFKPMGFEASFLKFLEESAVKQKKTTERDCHSAGTKKGSHSNARKHNEKTSVASNNVTWSCSENETLIPFANPSQLPCGDNVKIVLDKTFVRIVLEKTFKDCTERVLRQLQEMKPVVTLRKTEGHWEDNPDVLAAEVTVKGPKEGESKY